MGIGNYFMNTNVDLFHDSTKNSSGILPSFSHFFANLFNDSISLHSSGVHSIPASVKYFTLILLICGNYIQVYTCIIS